MTKTEQMHAFMALHFLCSTLLETLDAEGPEGLEKQVEAFRDVPGTDMHNISEPLFSEVMQYLEDQEIGK